MSTRRSGDVIAGAEFNVLVKCNVKHVVFAIARLLRPSCLVVLCDGTNLLADQLIYGRSKGNLVYDGRLGGWMPRDRTS